MSENHVRYSFTSGPLDGVAVEVDGIRLVESISDPYRLVVDITIDDADLEPAPLLAADCVLEMRRGDWSTRRVCGLIRHVEEGENSGDAQSARLTIVPALWMMGLRRNTRIFQEMSVPDILEAVLGESLKPYAREVVLDLSVSYPIREYCVQYGETDLDFVSRLMEEHGIHYTFDHLGEREQMILRDKNETFSDIPSGATVRYQPDSLEIVDHEPVQRFRRVHRDTTTSVVVWDWDWTKSGPMGLVSEKHVADEVGRDRESYEYGEGRSLQLWDYDAGARVYQKEDGKQQAEVRHDLHVLERLTGEAVTRLTQAEPGTMFELTGHPTPGLDGRYLITRVEHVSSAVGALIPGLGGADEYSNRLHCIPAEVPFRAARRAPKPRIDGVQTAVVTGASGEEIHTDEHGRIKVQFHWDREGKNDENSSCWIRVQQPWAGAGWGFTYLPRMGMEVVVHFVDGDPDRPLVSGCVYNGANLPPYPLPDEKTKSTIKSNSTIGGGGSNELRFEDKASSEEIYTHAQKDYNEVVENDHNTLVHHDQTITVDNDQTQTVHHDQIETVHNNQTVTVDGNRTVHVVGHFDETIDGTETRHVVGDVTESFSSNETRHVKGNLTEDITGNETREISANQTETISANHTLAVTGNVTHDITGALTHTVTGGITQTTPATYDINADGGLTIVAPGGIMLQGVGGVSFAAPGGVLLVDAFWDWIGVIKTEAGSFSPSIKLAKLEFAGMVFGATGLKIEQALAKFETYGTEIEVANLAIWALGSTLVNGGLKVSSGPSVEV